MFTAFGPEAIRYRLENSGCKVLVTNQEQAEKIADLDLSTKVLLTGRIDKYRTDILGIYSILFC